MSELALQYQKGMRKNITVAILAALVFALVQSPPVWAQGAAPNVSPAVFSWSLQLEMRVPFAPTAFPNGQKNHLLYEMYLTNFSEAPVTLVRMEVLNAKAKGGAPIAVFGADQLQTMVQPVGKSVSAPGDKLRLPSGQSAIVFVEVETNRSDPLPEEISHRIITSDAVLEGAEVETHHITPHLLAAPVHGENWLVADGPGNAEDNHHRRGVILLDGAAVDSRRFAIDWKQVKNGSSFSGDKRDVHSYFCFGQPVFAVADARVLTTKDGLPNNIPGHGDEFHPAVAINWETLAGNKIVLDLGDGQFAFYMHLQSGSLLVKPGAVVKKGQLIARIGASGDAREPHLHFEVTTSPELLRGEGIPYLLDTFSSTREGGSHSETHEHELPLDGDIVAFGR
jgi:Peptidase family M23